MTPSGRRQHVSSGQRETSRCGVSRPRNHLTSANGTPTLTENSPSAVRCVRVVHQKVPAGVSVYCENGLSRSSTSKIVRAVQCRQTGCPSTAPSGSAGNRTPSFSYALWMTPDSWTFMKCTRRPRRAVARLVNRWAAAS